MKLVMFRLVPELSFQDVHWGAGLFGYFPTYRYVSRLFNQDCSIVIFATLMRGCSSRYILYTALHFIVIACECTADQHFELLTVWK
jgi:hypothetical protein